jgi:predicted PurR-regulated permease PerM
MIHREKDTVISITAGTILKGIAILIGFYIAYLLRDLLLVIVVSVVLASSIEPAIKWFGKFRIHRIPAVLAIYLALVGFMAGVFYAFIPPLVDELYNFSQNLPTVAKELNVNFFRSDTSTVKKSETILTKITGNASPLQDISAGIGKVSTVSQNALGAATAIFGGVFSFILIVVLSFYFAMQEKGIEDFLRVIIPFDKEAYVISLWVVRKQRLVNGCKDNFCLGS